MLKTHYRQPIDWTMKSLEESAKTLDDWYRVCGRRRAVRAGGVRGRRAARRPQHAAGDRGAAWSAQCVRCGRSFARSLRLLGFLSESAAQWEGRKRQASGVDAGEVDRLIAERTAARARKDFKESDRIRDELAAKGVVIKDGKDPTASR